MDVFGLLNVADVNDVAAYGGDLEVRDRMTQCFSTFSFHTVACGGNQINATPRNKLSRLEYGRCIGGFIKQKTIFHKP